ncbi:hypothetical protein C8Q74DRAFT_377029 [Fomes fomentarius]|nr:hypothetical protein C8Q74DRAFT_377029 [Fomes fomentarius]
MPRMNRPICLALELVVRCICDTYTHQTANQMSSDTSDLQISDMRLDAVRHFHSCVVHPSPSSALAPYFAHVRH